MNGESADGFRLVTGLAIGGGAGRLRRAAFAARFAASTSLLALRASSAATCFFVFVAALPFFGVVFAFGLFAALVVALAVDFFTALVVTLDLPLAAPVALLAAAFALESSGVFALDVLGFVFAALLVLLLVAVLVPVLDADFAATFFFAVDLAAGAFFLVAGFFALLAFTLGLLAVAFFVVPDFLAAGFFFFAAILFMRPVLPTDKFVSRLTTALDLLVCIGSYALVCRSLADPESIRAAVSRGRVNYQNICLLTI